MLDLLTGQKKVRGPLKISPGMFNINILIINIPSVLPELRFLPNVSGIFCVLVKAWVGLGLVLWLLEFLQYS